MKEIHDAGFKFVPSLCVCLLQEVLLKPVPQYMLKKEDDGSVGSDAAVPLTGLGQVGSGASLKTGGQEGDCSLLPPPISHLLAGDTEACLTKRGKSILCAIRVPAPLGSMRSLTSRERILCALTDDAYA